MKTITQAEYNRQFYDRSAPMEEPFSLCLSEAEDFPLPHREPVSHKYSYGRALIIAGSTGFSGAPVLAANACERSGAGLTQLIVPESVYPIAASRCDGAVVTPLHADSSGTFSAEAAETLLPFLKRANACVIGPGLGLCESTERIVQTVLLSAECPLVLDADALTLCAKSPGLLESCHAPLILTPHEGEFRRIGGDLSEGRLAGAISFSRQHPEAILVLKGYGTLICRGDRVTVNPTGSPAMAKGGSGDVLCGILCALLAQGFDPYFSACCAVFLHGLAGDLTCDALGEYCVTPFDLIQYLPPAFRQITKQAP